MKKVTRFFWFCSGAHIDTLKKYPIEHNKYVGIGATIFFTALFAALSGGYSSSRRRRFPYPAPICSATIRRSRPAQPSGRSIASPPRAGSLRRPGIKAAIYRVGDGRARVSTAHGRSTLIISGARAMSSRYG